MPSLTFTNKFPTHIPALHENKYLFDAHARSLTGNTLFVKVQLFMINYKPAVEQDLFGIGKTMVKFLCDNVSHFGGKCHGVTHTT